MPYQQATKRWAVALIGGDFTKLVKTSLCLQGITSITYLVQTGTPITQGNDLPYETPDAAIIWLTGRENIEEIRSIVSSHPSTRFLFIWPHETPEAILMRVIEECGAGCLPGNYLPVLIAASLTSFMAQTAKVARQARSRR